jgi:hypothetical protein
MENVDKRRNSIRKTIDLMQRDIVPGYANDKSNEFIEFQSSIEQEYGLIYYDEESGTIHYNDDDNKPVPIDAPEGFIEWKRKRDVQKEGLSELINHLSQMNKTYDEMIDEIALTGYALEVSDIGDILAGTMIDDTSFEDSFYRFIEDERVDFSTVIFPEVAENIGYSYSVLSRDVADLPEIALMDNAFIMGYVSAASDPSKREPTELDNLYASLGDDVQARSNLERAKGRYLDECTKGEYLSEILALINREKDLEMARAQREGSNEEPQKTGSEMEK